jgi:hypothetical protein
MGLTQVPLSVAERAKARRKWRKKASTTQG